MIDPNDPIHPAAAALLAVCLVVAIAARLAFTHGPRYSIAALFVGAFAVLFVYSVAEMLTWAPDDPRWDDVAAVHEAERRRNRWL